MQVAADSRALREARLEAPFCRLICELIRRPTQI